MADKDLDIMAFPNVVPQQWAMIQDGMSLRDWFAGQALAGIMANPNPVPLDEGYYEIIADRSYLLAQLMLVERQKYEGEETDD